jgi:hypothetical protein
MKNENIEEIEEKNVPRIFQRMFRENYRIE